MGRRQVLNPETGKLEWVGNAQFDDGRFGAAMGGRGIFDVQVPDAAFNGGGGRGGGGGGLFGGPIAPYNLGGGYLGNGFFSQLANMGPAAMMGLPGQVQGAMGNAVAMANARGRVNNQNAGINAWQNVMGNLMGAGGGQGANGWRGPDGQGVNATGLSGAPAVQGIANAGAGVFGGRDGLAAQFGQDANAPFQGDAARWQADANLKNDAGKENAFAQANALGLRDRANQLGYQAGKFRAAGNTDLLGFGIT
jgi:hypothetical protein